MAKDDMTEKIMKLQKEPVNIRNMGIIAHIDHGKTTLSDSLVAMAGMISEHLAGQQRWLDFDEIEQERGITIQQSNVSMVHNLEDKEFLINLIDTPGHVDFGGDVTRAMRAVDGALVLTCAVEGAMPQTETVLRQALKERVRPILFINKVDRLIKELRLTPEAMQERFVRIIATVNEMIRTYAPPEYKEKWQVNVQDGSVGFGSAYHRWAINIPVMKATGISFADIINAYTSGEDEAYKELAKKAPLHKVLLDMVIKHLPNPKTAQVYRIPRLWHGDLETPEGKAMLNVDPNGPLIGCVTKIVNDPHAGEVACTRLFSGKLKAGQQVYLLNKNTEVRLQQVAVYKGAKWVLVDEIPAGNVAAIVGLKEAGAGETVSTVKIEPFEAIKHLFDPVVTRAIEPKNPKDLSKLILALQEIAREDPTLKVEINQETGEYLISGLGELHLEIWTTKLQRDWKLQIITSPPLVVYRESVAGVSPEMEGKSPNKHNKFYIVVEPLPEKVWRAISEGDISSTRLKKRDQKLEKELQELGLDKNESRKVVDIWGPNMLINATRGIVHLHEVVEYVVTGFREVMDYGPLAREKVFGLKVKLMDTKLHEDSIHRGPAQVIPAVRTAIKNAMLMADAKLLEPVQKIRIDTPQDTMSTITALVQSKRGKVLEVSQERNMSILTCKLPVSGMFGFTDELRSASSGRGFWSLMDSFFENLPKSLKEQTILDIRKRKGMAQELPRPKE
jgi:elongation factor 2